MLWTTSTGPRAGWSSLGARRARLQLGSWRYSGHGWLGKLNPKHRASPAQHTPEEYLVSGESPPLLVTLYRADQSQKNVVTQLLHTKQPAGGQPRQHTTDEERLPTRRFRARVSITELKATHGLPQVNRRSPHSGIGSV